MSRAKSKTVSDLLMSASSDLFALADELKGVGVPQAKLNKDKEAEYESEIALLEWMLNVACEKLKKYGDNGKKSVEDIQEAIQMDASTL